MAIKQALGEAYVDIVARLDRLDKGLEEAKRHSDASARKIERSFTTITQGIGGAVVALKTFIAGVIALSGASALGRAIRSNLDFLDSLDKISNKLGISTEFLQQVQYAASQSGVAFETVSMAMQRYVRRAGEASTGTGEAKDAIKELGIQLRDTNGRIRSSEDLFTQAMKALAGIQDPATRLRLAFKLFDSEGAVLVNLVDRFESLTDSARKLGIIVDDSVIRRGVEAKDTLDTLSKVTRAELAAALVDLTPALIDAGKALEFVTKWAAQAWMKFSDLLNLTPHTLDTMRDRVGELKRDISELVGDLTSARQIYGANSWIVTGGEYAIKQKREELKALQEQIATLERAMAPTGAPKITGPIVPSLTKEQEASLKHQLDMIQTIKIEWLNATGQRVKAIEAERDAAVKALDEQLLGEEQYQAARTQLYEIAAEKIKDLSEEGTLDLKKEWESLSSSASASLANMVADGEISFRALGQAFVREFVQRVLQALVFDQIFRIAGLAIGGGTGGAGGVTVGGGAASAGLQSAALTNPIGTVSVNAAAIPAVATSTNVQIINATSAPVQTNELADGDVQVFIGQQGAKDISAGGALAQAIESRYGVSARGVRR